MKPFNVFIEFANFLLKKQIPYCVVGKTEQLDSHIDGDIDIIFLQSDVKITHATIIDFCKTYDLLLVQCLHYGHKAFYYVIAWFTEGNPEFLKLDISSDFCRNDRMFLKPEKLLADRTITTLGKNGNGDNNCFYVPSPSSEFIYYLLKKVTKGGLSEDHGLHLHNEWRKDPKGCLKNINRFWNDKESNLIAQAATTNNWGMVQNAMLGLRKSLLKSISISWRCVWYEVLRKIRRIVYPTGLIVSFLGSDGSGKSSVLAALENDTVQAFRKSVRYHLRPGIVRLHSGENANATVTNPHGSKLYGLTISMLKLIFFWLDYALGYLFVTRWRKVFSTLVLFDRYYHDIMVDQRRYRYGGPQWLARIVGKLIPSPDLFLILVALPDIIRERKCEISYDECKRQNLAYADLSRKMKNAITIDANKPLEVVIQESDRKILNYMNRRTIGRLSAPSIIDRNR